MSSVAIKDRGISITDLSRVIEDDNLGVKVFSFSSRVILFIGANISSLDVFNGDILDIETNVIPRNGFQHRFVMHFNRLNFSGYVGWSEYDLHSRF